MHHVANLEYPFTVAQQRPFQGFGRINFKSQGTFCRVQGNSVEGDGGHGFPLHSFASLIMRFLSALISAVHSSLASFFWISTLSSSLTTSANSNALKVSCSLSTGSSLRVILSLLFFPAPHFLLAHHCFCFVVC